MNPASAFGFAGQSADRVRALLGALGLSSWNSSGRSVSDPRRGAQTQMQVVWLGSRLTVTRLTYRAIKDVVDCR